MLSEGQSLLQHSFFFWKELFKQYGNFANTFCNPVASSEALNNLILFPPSFSSWSHCTIKYTVLPGLWVDALRKFWSTDKKMARCAVKSVCDTMGIKMGPPPLCHTLVMPTLQMSWEPITAGAGAHRLRVKGCSICRNPIPLWNQRRIRHFW